MSAVSAYRPLGSATVAVPPTTLTAELVPFSPATTTYWPAASVAGVPSRPTRLTVRTGVSSTTVTPTAVCTATPPAAVAVSRALAMPAVVAAAGVSTTGAVASPCAGTVSVSAPAVSRPAGPAAASDRLKVTGSAPSLRYTTFLVTGGVSRSAHRSAPKLTLPPAAYTAWALARPMSTRPAPCV
jgi:hypothetical protein